MKRGHSRAYFPMRVEWLRQHSEVWELDHQEIFRRMRGAGLFARSTYWKDVDLNTMLAAAKIPRDAEQLHVSRLLDNIIQRRARL